MKALTLIVGILIFCVSAYAFVQSRASVERASEEQTQQTEITTIDMTEQKNFLEINGQRPEVTTTASGLQYEVLESKESGDSPVLTSEVEVHYHGTTIDGNVFDSSVERGMPITFPLSQVIQGWQEGVQLMKVGEKFKFFIPSELAYGDMSPSPAIPAGATLIFEVELLSIK